MASEMKDDEPQVEIDSTAPSMDELARTEDTAAPAASGTPKVDAAPVVSEEEGVDALKAKLADAERRARENERVATELANRAAAEYKRAEQSDLQVIEAGISSINRDNEILRANLQTFLRTGQFDKAAEIQERLAENAATRRELEQGKQAVTEGLKRAPEPVQVSQTSDPVEAFAQQLKPASADWVRKHPDYVTNQRLNKQLRRAHEDAVDDGHSIDSPGYFKFIEGALGISGGEAPTRKSEVDTDSPMSGAAAAASRRSAPPAAPVSRSDSGAGTGQRGTIRLTAAEAEAAKLSGLSPKEYWDNKQALLRAGKMTVN